MTRSFVEEEIFFLKNFPGPGFVCQILHFKNGLSS